jgi:microcompartment protein CcmL/EutN
MKETKKLIGAIEAVNTASKAAQVKLVSREKVIGALINPKDIREAAEVRSIIDAGTAAAQKAGQIITPE